MSNNKPFMARQGDVLIMRIDTLPEGLKPAAKDKRVGRDVLAYGEVTGHHHSVLDPKASNMFIDEGSSDILELRDKYLNISEDTEIEHQEHDSIPLGPGIYKVMRQVEYAPEGYRAVAD